MKDYNTILEVLKTEQGQNEFKAFLQNYQKNLNAKYGVPPVKMGKVLGTASETLGFDNWHQIRHQAKKENKNSSPVNKGFPDVVHLIEYGDDLITTWNGKRIKSTRESLSKEEVINEANRLGKQAFSDNGGVGTIDIDQPVSIKLPFVTVNYDTSIGDIIDFARVLGYFEHRQPFIECLKKAQAADVDGLRDVSWGPMGMGLNQSCCDLVIPRNPNWSRDEYYEELCDLADEIADKADEQNCPYLEASLSVVAWSARLEGDDKLKQFTLKDIGAAKPIYSGRTGCWSIKESRTGQVFSVFLEGLFS